MPRKQAQLVPFLQKALDVAKYRNLTYEDCIKKVFCLYLPHKTNRLEMEDQYIFNDWYAETKRKYTFSEEYTNARQAMTAALRKSDFVELKPFPGNKLICRILNKEEVEEKKRQKKESKRLKGKQEDRESESSIESGYESGLNSPESCMDYGQNDKNLLQGVVHDHAYVFSPLGMESAEGSGFHSDIREVSNEVIVIDEAVETFNLLGTYLEEDFSEIPILPEVVTVEDLDKVQASDLIGAEAREKWYICEKYEPLDNAVLLICKLLQEMDVGIVDTSSNIRIIFDEAMQKGLQRYSFWKKWEKIDDHNLMVILELPFMSHR